MSHETIALADKFITENGTGPITVEQFDIWIIDNEMAEDPGDKEEYPQLHKAFIVERAAAKRTLNSAAQSLPDNAFCIKVRTRGELYEVCTWSVGADESLGNLGNSAKRYVSNKAASLSTLKNSAQRLMKLDPSNAALQEAFQVLAMVESEGALLSARVDAMALHYDSGVESARAYAKQRIEDASSITLRLAGGE
jgi:hypothetical protein